MKIAYSCQLDPPKGFSLVAYYAIDALKKKGYLHQLLIPSSVGLNDRTSEKYDFYFDHVAAERLNECDIFVGWANASLKQIMKAKKFGATTFIDRGSAHILYQKELLEKEGMKLDLEVVDRQLKEYEEVDYIIVDSTFIKESFELFDNSSKVHILTLGVDTEKYYPNYSKKQNSKFIALFVGGNWIRKGLKYLIKAWQEANLENAELRIIGGNIYEYSNKNIKFIGHVDDIVKEYQNADVFILPSIEDGFALVVLEAMASGLPVIISNNVGAKDCVESGKEGFVIPAGNLRSLAYCIKFLYDNSEKRIEMGLNARKKAEMYSWRRYQQSFVDLIEQTF